MAEPLRIERRGAEEGWAAVSILEPRVYTVEMMQHVEWHDVWWSHAEQWVLGWIGDLLVTAVGIYSRMIEANGTDKLAGGIGGVMTHPDHQRRGYAEKALDEANRAIDAEIEPAFSLLFVEPHNEVYYAKRGWRMFTGDVIVEERGQRGAFGYMGAMVRDGVESAPERGTIDMRGRPW